MIRKLDARAFQRMRRKKNAPRAESILVQKEDTWAFGLWADNSGSLYSAICHRHFLKSVLHYMSIQHLLKGTSSLSLCRMLENMLSRALWGLQDYRYFASATVEYAKTKGVALKSQVVTRSLSQGVAFGFIKACSR